MFLYKFTCRKCKNEVKIISSSSNITKELKRLERCKCGLDGHLVDFKERLRVRDKIFGNPEFDGEFTTQEGFIPIDE